MVSKKILIPALALALVGGGIGAAVASRVAADSQNSSSSSTSQNGGEKEHGPGVAGTVSSINGSTITLTGADGKTYTIDASTATIEKLEAITAGQIAVGDTLMIGGTVNGTQVSAAHIMDGALPQGTMSGRGHMFGMGMMGWMKGMSHHGSQSGSVNDQDQDD